MPSHRSTPGSSAHRRNPHCWRLEGLWVCGLFSNVEVVTTRRLSWLRHNDLMALIQGSSWATDDVLARLRSLEAEGPAAGPPLWESVVMSSGAADDERVIEASRRVWEALGPNAYAVQFKPRPQTWRGFLEGRGWLVVGMAGLVVIAILADEVNQRWGWYWLLLLPLFIAWPALLYIAFSRRYRGLEARGGKELPHLNL